MRQHSTVKPNVINNANYSLLTFNDRVFGWAVYGPYDYGCVQ